MNAFASRKRLLIAQADLHRGLLELERSRWQERGYATSTLVRENRWWLIGGAVVGGVVLVRNWRGLARTLPAAVAVWRGLTR